MKRLMILLALLFVGLVPVARGEGMTTQLYIVPIIKISLGDDRYYNVPAYLWHRLHPGLPELEGVPWAWTTYLLEDVAILIADTDAAQHAVLEAQVGVFPVPDLDASVPSNLVANRMRGLLQDVYVPGAWVERGDIYRDILRHLAGMFDYHNRAVALSHGRFFEGVHNLNTRWDALTTIQQDALSQAATEYDLDFSGVVDSTTLGEIFMLAFDVYGASNPYEIRGAGLSLII